jgi:photosystem II stability/assembly factor-like uncharacterized protein
LPQGAYLTADGATANNLYAYDHLTGNFYTSTNKGSSWSQTASLYNWASNIVTPFGKSCDIWLYGYAGVYHNTTCGSGTWTQLSGATSIEGLGFGKAASGQTYPAMYMSGILNNVSGLFRSIDGGNTWVKINDNAHQYAGFGMVTGDPKVFGTVYTSSNSARGVIMGTSPN